MAVENSLVTSAFSKYGTTGKNIGEDKSILDKDDFLKLLLTELQNQDPTNPQDTDKILQQTSQLATLEASQNTNEALSKLSSSIQNSAQFATISSIGKMANTGVDGINLEEGKSVQFDVYFPESIQSGTIEIVNSQGITVDKIDVDAQSKGVVSFDWDGVDDSGNPYPEGKYTLNIAYTSSSGENRSAKFGVYPVEAVRFENGEAQFKLGSQYVPLNQIKEIYDPEV